MQAKGKQCVLVEGRATLGAIAADHRRGDDEPDVAIPVATWRVVSPCSRIEAGAATQSGSCCTRVCDVSVIVASSSRSWVSQATKRPAVASGIRLPFMAPLGSETFRTLGSLRYVA